MIKLIVNRNHFNGRRALMVIHLVLVLLLPFMLTQMGGCQGENDVMPMNLGPEVTAEEIDEAISKPLASTDPVSIRLGEAFVVSETQELGGGAAFAVISDTSQTVVERSETADEVNIVVIEHKQKYIDGQVQKTSTEIPYRIEKAPVTPELPLEKVANGLASAVATDGGEGSSAERTITSTSPQLRPEITSLMESLREERSPRVFVHKLIQQAKMQNSAAAKSGVSPLESKITFHGLKVDVVQEPPPRLVQEQENCLDIPACRITVHRVSFDMVFWDDGKPDRVHWNLVMSDEAPFLAAMLDRCITGLAKLSGDQGSILVKQCAPVLNFRYGQ